MWGTFTIHQWCHTHFSESMIGSVAGAGVWSPLGAVSVLFGWGQKSKFHEVSHTRMLSSSRTNFRSDWAFNSLLTSTRSNRKAKFWFLNDPPKRGDSFFFVVGAKYFFFSSWLRDLNGWHFRIRWTFCGAISGVSIRWRLQMKAQIARRTMHWFDLIYRHDESIKFTFENALNFVRMWPEKWMKKVGEKMIGAARIGGKCEHFYIHR